MRRILPLIAFFVPTFAVLIALGVWQVQRLDWKTRMLAEIAARIAAAPVAVPPAPDPERDRYLPVMASGRTTGDELHVLVSTERDGAGYRIIAPFEMADRRILLDLGYVPTTDKSPVRPAQVLTVTGNLHWPDEIDGFTPAPDIAANIWFARDVPAMADALGTLPVMIVARETDPPIPGTVPLPIAVDGIPNNHLNYALTWFSLAAIWAVVTAVLGWRMATRSD